MATRAEVVWRACAIMVAHRRAREHMRECMAPCCAEALASAAHSRCAAQRSSNACMRAHANSRVFTRVSATHGRRVRRVERNWPSERTCMRAVNINHRHRHRPLREQQAGKCAVCR